MTNIPPDGTPVSYIGPPRDGLAMGDRGLLLIAAGRGAHVQLVTGARAGKVLLLDADDLVPASRAVPGNPVTAAFVSAGDGLDDSLDVGQPTALGLGHLCALRGPGAVLSAIAAHRPADLDAVRAEVLAFAEERIATTATIRAATAQLDDEESAELVRLATTTLMRETFGVESG